MSLLSVLSHFPTFELSYETISHKKVFASNDSVGIAISMGKKYFVWFTFDSKNESTCFLIELNKDKHPCAVSQLHHVKPTHNYVLGTILYGTISESMQDGIAAKSPFIVEDVYYFQGNRLGNSLAFGDKIGFLKQVVTDFYPAFVLPIMWHVETGKELVATPALSNTMAYTPHHIQYREICRLSPYMNIPIPKRGAVTQVTQAQPEPVNRPTPRFDYSNPQHKVPTVFHVTADMQYDIYHLYAFGSNCMPVYVGLAAMPTYKTSIFMNSVFRNIRENRNIDLIEESDDEGDFENLDETKYVDLEKVVAIECVFHTKHKKWVPTRLAREDQKVVHIRKLVESADNQNHSHNPGHNQNQNYRKRSFK
jgi:hypothetical protein